MMRFGVVALWAVFTACGPTRSSVDDREDAGVAVPVCESPRILVGQCGRTGVAVRVDIAERLTAGVDYNQIRIMVEEGLRGWLVTDTFPVTASSPRPFIVRIYADETKTQQPFRLQVRVLMDSTVVLDRIVTDQAFVAGEMTDLSVSFL